MHTFLQIQIKHTKFQEVLLEVRLLVTISMARFESRALTIPRFVTLHHFQWS
jgi:hypothetical protein